MAKTKTSAVTESAVKKPRKKKFTLNMALREAGVSGDEEKYLIEPRVALAMARAAKREIATAKKEADRVLRIQRSELLSKALKQVK